MSKHKLILSKAQAEAVYSAMCELNNVRGRMAATLDGGFMVREDRDGTVFITGPGANWMERHDNQSAFAVAHGLATGA